MPGELLVCVSAKDKYWPAGEGGCNIECTSNQGELNTSQDRVYVEVGDVECLLELLLVNLHGGRLLLRLLLAWRSPLTGRHVDDDVDVDLVDLRARVANPIWMAAEVGDYEQRFAQAYKWQLLRPQQSRCAMCRADEAGGWSSGLRMCVACVCSACRAER